MITGKIVIEKLRCDCGRDFLHRFLRALDVNAIYIKLVSVASGRIAIVALNATPERTAAAIANINGKTFDNQILRARLYVPKPAPVPVQPEPVRTERPLLVRHETDNSRAYQQHMAASMEAAQ